MDNADLQYEAPSSANPWADLGVLGGLGQDAPFEEWSGDQEKAISAVMEFLRDPVRKSMSLGGVAGSGKSALIPWIASSQGGVGENGAGPVAVCAYTGKAVVVLRRRGIQHAQTLHSFLYNHVGTPKPGGGVKWTWQEKPAESFRGVRLAVVDEASMVGPEMHRMLSSLPFKVLYVGDHFQLPPIGDGALNLMAKPDFRMEEVLRQRADSPVVSLATAARMDGAIPLGSFGESRHTRAWNAEEAFLNHDVVLVWTNRERLGANLLARELRGLPAGQPVEDDRMLVRANCREKNIFNGQMVYLVNDGVWMPDGSCKCRWVDEIVHDDPVAGMYGEPEEAKCSVGLSREELQRVRDLEMEWQAYLSSRNRRGTVRRIPMPKAPKPPFEAHLDWGYAVTVHSAQGSGWPSVAVVVNDGLKHFDWYRRWLYTAITRASERVTIYSGSQAAAALAKAADR